MMAIEGFLYIHAIFTAVGVSFLTGIRPAITTIPPDNQLLFRFPDTPEVRKAIHDFMAGERGLKTFSELYKTIRGELYTLKNLGGDAEGVE